MTTPSAARLAPIPIVDVGDAGPVRRAAEDLRDGLSQEFDLHHGLLKGFLEKIIDFVDALLDE